MQITLVQAEIETAIRNFILSQINLREGMSVAIELAATRGANGFTAMIDISSQAAEVPQIQAPTPRPPFFQIPTFSQSRAPQTPTEVHQMMETKVEEEEATPAPTPEPSANVIEMRSSQDETIAHPEVAAEVTPEAPVEVVAPRPPSLFKNLRKPVNA